MIHAKVQIGHADGKRFFNVTHPAYQGRAITVYSWSAAQRRARTLATAVYYQGHYH